MQELIEQFIRERMYFKNVNSKTVAWYRQSFHAFEGAIDTRAAIGQRIGQLRERGVSAASVNTYLRVVNAFHSWAKAEGHVTGERVHIPRLKEEQKVLETLTPEHIQRIVSFRPKKVSERRVHVIVCVLLDTGLRINEAFLLTREDVDLENLLLRVNGKGSKQRIVPISMEGRKVLWKWLRDKEPYDLVFATRSGTLANYRNYLRDFKILGKKLQITGVRLSFHTLRHTFAVNYIRNGGDVFRLQRVLGHSTLEMTRRYVNLQTADLQSVHDKFSLLAVVGRGVAGKGVA